MSTGNPKRKRADRVATIAVPPSPWSQFWKRITATEAMTRMLMCLAAAIVMWAVSTAWRPPFPYQRGQIPPRDIVAQVTFSRPDPEQLETLRRRRRSETVCIYSHDEQPLVELREGLSNRMFELLAASDWASIDMDAWEEFYGDAERNPEMEEQAFLALRAALTTDMELKKFQAAVAEVFQQFESDGLLDSLHKREDGSQTAILVHPVGNEDFLHRVDVGSVQIADAESKLKTRLSEAFRKQYGATTDHAVISQFAHTWLERQGLPPTLKINEQASEEARRVGVDSVEMPQKTYQPGELLCRADVPLQQADLDLLGLEYSAANAARTWTETVGYSAAYFGLFGALYLLVGTYLVYHMPGLLRNQGRLIALLTITVATVAACIVAAHDHWRAELAPLTMLGMTLAIVHRRELALLVASSVALVVTFAVGHGLSEFVVLIASVGASVIPVTRIRSRTKLIYIGMLGASVTFMTTLGVGTLSGQTFASGDSALMPEWLATVSQTSGYALMALQGALWNAFCVILAGLLMTALLPFIERFYDIQTDISLLELGDASHPLLQELARRAPGTYNHSITVASLAEAAADAIGANGLLVRVGAYFHDIGKMLKPKYFIENQGLKKGSEHESLVPAMSTLVIIAHVKDGADLARQHGLPQSFIDFIEQHHGTTLVEYFYRQAEKEGEETDEEVDESTFRYPGPKPQTREAAVMMLADVCESASRALSEPAPARIEHLVDELAMKRLLDGQFDECGLTLKELALVKESLAKSLTAVYHGRVKYPDQQTA